MKRFKLFLVVFALTLLAYMIYLPFLSYKKDIKPHKKVDIVGIEANITQNLELNATIDDNSTNIISLKLLDIVDEKIAIGFLKARSKIEEKSLTTLYDGVVEGVNFEELFCRANAFSKGQLMPSGFIRQYYEFDEAKFEQSGKKNSYKNLVVDTSNFRFSAQNVDPNSRSKATLEMKRLFKNSCGVDWRYLEMVLQLWCDYKKDRLSCALDLKNLIVLLSGVKAKVTKIEVKEEIGQLREDLSLSHKELIKNIENDNLDNLKQEFKSRYKQKSSFEEVDLRDLFVP